MEGINKIIENIRNIEIESIIDIWIAVAIVIFFRIFRGTVAYIIIKMFKFKENNSKKIKNNAFYEPIRSFIGFLGIYLAILFLKEPLNISDYIINIITRIFRITIIITTAIALSNSITTKSSIINKIKEKAEKEIDKNTIRLVVRIIKIIIYIIAGFLVITELGYNLNGLITGLGIGSVVITLAAQDTAKNIFGGLVIVLDKPFKVGDDISVKTYEGTVEDITFRSTRVRTTDNSVLYIPNSEVVASAVINLSQKNKSRYKTIISIDAKTSLEKVEKCKVKILQMLEAQNMVLKDNIKVNFFGISEKGIDILIDCFVDTVKIPEFFTIKEEINYKIMQIFINENIQLAGNLQTICIKN